MSKKSKSTKKFKPGERLIARMFQRALALEAVPGSPIVHRVHLAKRQTCKSTNLSSSEIVDLAMVGIPNVGYVRIVNENLKLVPEVPGEISEHRVIVRDHLRLLDDMLKKSGKAF